MGKIIFYGFSYNIYKRIKDTYYKEMKIPKEIEDSIIKEISNTSIKVLIPLMNVYIDNKIISGSNSNERYDKFDKYSSSEDFFKIVKDSYQQLIIKLNCITRAKINNYVNLSKRYEKDRNELDSLFGFQAEDILDCNLKVSLSDVHNGEENYILEYKNKKVVYKTRGSDIDIFFGRIISWINSKVGEDLLYGVRTINKEKYSWHEYIEYSELFSEGKVKEFYYKMGSLSFLAYLFDMTDIHMENIICSSKGPIIVDTETICQIIINKSGKDLSYFNKKLFDSIIKTELFPCSNLKNITNIDISGICGNGGQVVKNRILMVDKPFSDKMNLRMISGRLEERENIPKINKEFVNPKNYESYIEKGFVFIYKLILKYKEEFKRLVKYDENLKRAKFRVVFHDTQMYKDIIDFSNFPRNLSEEGLKEIYSIIRSLCDKKDEALINDIYENLIVGNIPIYFGELESKFVKNNVGVICYKHNIVPATQISNKINKLDYDDMNFQIKLIKLSLLNFRKKYKNAEFSMKKILKQNNIINDNIIKNEILNIANKMENTSFRSQNGYINWLTVENNYPNWKVIFQNSSLYSGLSGNAIFFASVYKLYRQKKHFDILIRILNTIEKKLEYEEKNSSAFNGTFSVTYLYLFLYKQGFGQIYYRKALELVENHKELIVLNKNYDFLDGLSGILTILIQIYKLDKNDYILEKINNISNKLISNIKIEKNKALWSNEEILTGFAHGLAGIIYALSELYKITGLKKYLRIASRLIINENYYFNQEEENWTDTLIDRKMTKDDTVIQWCHGATGIGLSRMKINSVLNNNDDMQRALNVVIKYGLYKENDSICHGNIGNLSFLIEYNNIYGDKNIKK